MTVKLTSTRGYGDDTIKCLVYGAAGIGKTCLCATAPDPVIISNEGGLLSLSGVDLPVYEVDSIPDIESALSLIVASKQYKTICLDSLTEIAEVVLSRYKDTEKDPRNAYGKFADEVSKIIRKFRDLKTHNVYFTAKMIKFVDDSTGVVTYIPGMPGKLLLNGLPYFFDEMFVMRMGKLPTDEPYRYLQTAADWSYEAKDRSGKLPPQAPPDLTWVFNKISVDKQ